MKIKFTQALIAIPFYVFFFFSLTDSAREAKWKQVPRNKKNSCFLRTFSKIKGVVGRAMMAEEDKKKKGGRGANKVDVKTVSWLPNDVLIVYANRQR